jgi:hypothetical protein
MRNYGWIGNFCDTCEGTSSIYEEIDHDDDSYFDKRKAKPIESDDELEDEEDADSALNCHAGP